LSRKTKKYPKWLSRDKLLIFSGIALLCIGVMAGLFFSVRWILYKNPFFDIKEISTPALGLPKETIYAIRNRNILGLDLEKLYADIRKQYPYAKEIIIKKHLPNKLEITITKRKPVLLIRKNKKIYPVDELGMALPSTQSLPSSKMLEVIIDNKTSVIPGRSVKDEGIFLAIKLIKALKETKLLDVFDFTSIDAREPYELRLYMKNNIVWKMRTHSYKDKLVMFKKQIMNNYLGKLPRLKKGNYLLFSDDGTVTSSI